MTQKLVASPPPQHPFTSMFKSMSDARVSKMLENLSTGAQFSENEFYQLYIGEKNKEAQRFLAFFQQHHIKFLGGNNSKNFIIQSKPGTSPSSSIVLKLENRLGQPIDIENKLRESKLSSIFTPIHAKRESQFMERGVPVTATVMVMDYCPRGDLEQHAASHPTSSARLEASLTLYSQMATILSQMQMNEFAFPDMKNTNWLVDANERVRVADGKSFVVSDVKNGLLDFASSANSGLIGVHTGYMLPPDLDAALNKIEPCNTDKLHACLLGKNLYQYLTKCDYLYLSSKNNQSGQAYGFSDPIFSSPQGLRLKQLIIQSVDLNPRVRPSVKNMLAELNTIQRLPLQGIHAECVSLLDKFQPTQPTPSTQVKDLALRLTNASNLEDYTKLKQELTAALMNVNKKAGMDLLEQVSSTYRLGVNDTSMNDYIQKKKVEIDQERNPVKLDALLQNVRSTADMLKKEAPQLSSLRNELHKLMTGTEGDLLDKVLALQQQTLTVPVEQRGAHRQLLAREIPDMKTTQQSLLNCYQCLVALSKDFPDKFTPDTVERMKTAISTTTDHKTADEYLQKLLNTHQKLTMEAKIEVDVVKTQKLKAEIAVARERVDRFNNKDENKPTHSPTEPPKEPKPPDTSTKRIFRRANQFGTDTKKSTEQEKDQNEPVPTSPRLK